MAGKVNPIPHEGTIAHLVVDGAAKALDFYKQAFGAEEMARHPAPDGKRIMHAAMRIGSSVLFLADDFPEFCGGKSRNPKKLGVSPVTLHFYVTDVDAAVARAAKAGATVVMPATDMFWGDRYAKLTDPFGHEWSLATHVKDVSPAEMEAASKQAFSGKK